MQWDKKGEAKDKAEDAVDDRDKAVDVRARIQAQTGAGIDAATSQEQLRKRVQPILEFRPTS